MHTKPSPQLLVEVFTYCPQTGELRFKIDRGKKRAGELVAHRNDAGYIIASINRVRFRAHRAAWAMMTGAWPVEEIDHINLIKDDNRWVNLREASRLSQMHNLGKFSTNTSGFKGVSLCKRTNRWQAHIRADGKNYRLGRFDSPELAHQAYCEAADRLHGAFASYG